MRTVSNCYSKCLAATGKPLLFVLMRWEIISPKILLTVFWGECHESGWIQSLPRSIASIGTGVNNQENFDTEMEANKQKEADRGIEANSQKDSESIFQRKLIIKKTEKTSEPNQRRFDKITSIQRISHPGFS